MCRLFGLHAGTDPASATFWLLDAPDSLRAQSRRNPDGAGIGVFGADGRPSVRKHPIAAWEDTDFACAAQELSATTFVAHVRHASTGAHTVDNTHPFEQDGRLFAHNGVVAGLTELDERLREVGAADFVRGETDSERVFALVSAEIARSGGDVGAGITAAIGWIAANVPVYSVNFVLTTATDVWALRYPAANELWLLERPGGQDGGVRALDARTDRIRARSAELSDRPSVVLASEPMDGESGWSLIASGELVHVCSDLEVQVDAPFPPQPARQLTIGDLDPAVGASQRR